MILSDLGRALAQISDPRFLIVLLKAMALAAVLLAAGGWVFVQAVGWVLPDRLADGALAGGLGWAAVALWLVVSAFVIIPVAFLCVGLFLEEIAAAVEARHYPHLPAAAGQPLAAVLGDTVRLLLLVGVANAAALVVYLISTVFAPLVFWAVNGLLLGREYFQLSAARRLGTRPATALRRRHRLEIWMLGALLAVPLTMPLIGLAVPVLGVAAYTHMVQRLAAEGAVT
ncbi:MAG: EI24 domain-containing protein [Pseudomonadota bacterium]